jgi:hypothetical protein
MTVIIINKSSILYSNISHFLENRLLLLKLWTLITMYAKFISFSAVEPFVLFLFTSDYLNLEMLKIFYLLRVYLKNVYFCMIFTFVFFFERSTKVPTKIPVGSIHDKEIEHFTFSYIHCLWLFIIGLHCGFCDTTRNISEFSLIWPSPDVRDVG